jgi:DNA-binding response OmpR family regulator
MTEASPVDGPPDLPVDVVVTDDEPALRAMIADYLGAAGFRVRLAADAAGLDRLLREAPARIILLDVNMPGEDGLAAARRLRRQGVRAGLLMLTAQGEEEARVAGLAGGADDYVVKPFALSELLARIRAVLRRLPPEPPAPALLRFGAARIDAAARRIIEADGSEGALSEPDLALIEAFLRHPRQVLGRDRLAELARGRSAGGRAAEGRALDIRVARLRKRVEADPANPRAIRTLRGEGYVYEPD